MIYAPPSLHYIENKHIKIAKDQAIFIFLNYASVELAKNKLLVL